MLNGWSATRCCSSRDGAAGGAPGGEASAALAVLADVTGPPLARALADFWAPGLSPARLRALTAPPAAPAVPGLLLRMTDPPPVTVRGKDLRDVLAPAYEQFAAADAGASADDGR